jgi:hypothetical protein
MQTSDGITCDDVGTPADCVNGVWTCPTGMVDEARCDCFFTVLPPGCTNCKATGGLRCDAGVDGSDADANLAPTDR